MFDSALMESGDRIQTKSKYWMFATTFFNAAIVAAMVLVPLLYPEALPRSAVSAMLQPPPLPHAAPQQPPAQPAHAMTRAVAWLNPLVAPTQIPDAIRRNVQDAPPQIGSGVRMSNDVGDQTSGIPDMVATGPSLPVVSVKPKRPTIQRVSAGVIAGMAISRSQPVYPSIARAAHVQGTVELHAIIAKDGTIQNLNVMSGPEMLRGAAVDAVKTWRYRPYLLNGEPTEVDTTITVNFTLGG